MQRCGTRLGTAADQLARRPAAGAARLGVAAASKRCARGLFSPWGLVGGGGDEMEWGSRVRWVGNIRIVPDEAHMSHVQADPHASRLRPTPAPSGGEFVRPDLTSNLNQPDQMEVVGIELAVQMQGRRAAGARRAGDRHGLRQDWPPLTPQRHMGSGLIVGFRGPLRLPGAELERVTERGPVPPASRAATAPRTSWRSARRGLPFQHAQRPHIRSRVRCGSLGPSRAPRPLSQP